MAAKAGLRRGRRPRRRCRAGSGFSFALFHLPRLHPTIGGEAHVVGVGAAARRAAERDDHLPVHGHRGLDAAGAGPSAGVKQKSSRSTSGYCAKRSTDSGRAVDNQGDSFFVVFTRARNAVAAAVAVQRALEWRAWPDGPHVRVRIGSEEVALRRTVRAWEPPHSERPQSPQATSTQSYPALGPFTHTHERIGGRWLRGGPLRGFPPCRSRIPPAAARPPKRCSTRNPKRGIRNL